MNSDTNRFELFLYLLIFIIILKTCNSRPCPPGNFKEYGKNGKCDKCPPGYYGNPYESSCGKCPSNTYTPYFGVTSSSLCLPCPSGSTASPGSRKCKKCINGLVTDCGTCVNCKPGEYLSRYTCECEKCSEGSVSRKTNSKYCMPCPTGYEPNKRRSKCVLKKCPVGQEWRENEDSDSRECSYCRFDKYRKWNMTACRPCGPRQVSKYTDFAATGCETCKPGTYVYQYYDLDVSLIFISESAYGRKCEKCPKGTTTKGFGKLICRRHGKSCPRGTFVDKDGDCDYCDAGYRFSKSKKHCIKCGKNQVSRGRLRTKCIICGPNSLVYPDDLSRCDCEPGYVWDLRKVRCVPCSAGTYYYSTKRYSARCESCPPKEISGKAALDCKRCSAGFSSEGTNRTACLKVSDPNVKCPKGMIIPGKYSHYPTNDQCVDAISGCPKQLKLYVTERNNLICQDSNGNIVCPKGYEYSLEIGCQMK